MKKSIRVKQRDVSDCGPACLVSVAAYFGLHISVSRVRQYADTGKQGTSLRGLMEAATHLNFHTRAAKAAQIPFSGIPVPAIFHQTDENGLQHFVVVYKIKKKQVRYMDPATGKMVSMPVAVFKKNWSGVILLLMPTVRFNRGNEKTPVFIRFWQLIYPHRAVMIRAIMGAVLYSILGLSTSVYIQKIIDSVLPEANGGLINVLSLLMIGVLCFQIIAGYLKSMIVLRTGQQIDSRLILRYYQHVLGLPQRFFSTMRVGEIVSRLNDAVRIRIFINEVALGVVVNALTILISLIAMFIYYPKLALIIMAAIPFYIIVYMISDKVNAKWQRKIMETGAALESHLIESIQGAGTIRRFRSESYFHLKTENKLVPFLQAVFSGNRSGLILSNVSEWMTGLMTIAILWTGSRVVIDGYLTAGELLSFYTMAAFFTSPVRALIGANKPIQDALVAADRLFEIMDLETEKEIQKNLTIDRVPDGDVLFKNVYFSHGIGHAVFRDLNLRIPHLFITAITGESGCGKSTLVLLIQKFCLADAGNISIGDSDIRYIPTDLLRKHIATVPQHTDLFEGDFISNIALGEHRPDPEKILNICKRLGLHDFIDHLPHRYHTIIREQGMNLSGGQKQKIGIARALYAEPSILILDEATSFLDPESERNVQDTLYWFYNHRKTIVIISHRLATIRFCNSIIFFIPGGGVISGTHENLLLECPEYMRWWGNTTHADVPCVRC